MKFKFPENFLWGSATASHQVEGGNVNDWSIWEKKNAERLAKESKKKFGKLPVWESIKDEAENPQNYISGIACDHYNRYEEDFDIVKSLGQNAFRFSIEWSRIEPEEGRFDEKEIEHYKKVIKALKVRGIEPFVTLWHWSNPLWISDIGGWENKEIVFYFGRYVKKIVTALDEDVKFWITLNEPDDIYSIFSYLKGVFPPQKRNIYKTIKVFINLIKSHKNAYKIIHENVKNAQVGIANNVVCYEVFNNNFINRILKIISDYFWNFLFLNKILDCQDFIGCNYYHHNEINYGFNKSKNKDRTDVGWNISPKGIYCVLNDLKKYNLPIYITENGIADMMDQKREKFIKDHLIWIAKAMEEGLDVRGYLYWSLLDNFEWDKGFWPRFGLVEVDYKTLERKIRPSAYEYAKICKANEIEI